jgi:hypothetical protein
LSGKADEGVVKGKTDGRNYAASFFWWSKASFRKEFWAYPCTFFEFEPGIILEWKCSANEMGDSSSRVPRTLPVFCFILAV